MLKIGIWWLQWSPQPILVDTYPLFTPGSNACGFWDWFKHFGSSFTLPLSHYKYDKWLYYVRIRIHYVYNHYPQTFKSSGWQFQTPTFHSHIKCVWIDSNISLQVDPSNVSSWLVKWRVRQGSDWNLLSTIGHHTTTCFRVPAIGKNPV